MHLISMSLMVMEPRGQQHHYSLFIIQLHKGMECTIIQPRDYALHDILFLFNHLELQLTMMTIFSNFN
jgi:hypothetical protein